MITEFYEDSYTLALKRQIAARERNWLEVRVIDEELRRRAQRRQEQAAVD